MCYTISPERDRKELEKISRVKIPSWAKKKQYKLNGHEFPKIEFFTRDHEKNLSASIGNWGLIPRWTLDETKALSIREYTLNAQIESAHEKPSYKHLLTTNRCIVFVSGFFEWRELNKQKYPYYIYPAKGGLFCLGGLYDEWVNRSSGEIVKSVTLLTTRANPLMEFIHNRKKRMPVILGENQLERFTDPNEPLEHFEIPYPETNMSSHTISKLITDRTKDSDVPEVIEPYTYPDLNELF